MFHEDVEGPAHSDHILVLVVCVTVLLGLVLSDSTSNQQTYGVTMQDSFRICEVVEAPSLGCKLFSAGSTAKVTKQASNLETPGS